MIKYTKHFLKKIEDLFKELKYTIRYERGNFKSGYCIVEDRQIAVINRFFEVEARINVLLEILGTVEIDGTKLDDKNAALFKQLKAFGGNDAEAAKEAAEEVEKEIAEAKADAPANEPIEETVEAATEVETKTEDVEATIANEPEVESEAKVLTTQYSEGTYINVNKSSN